MNESYIRNVVEAALLAAGGPLPVAELMRLFDEAAVVGRRQFSVGRGQDSRDRTSRIA